MERHFREYILKVYGEPVDHGLRWEYIDTYIFDGLKFEVYRVNWYNMGDFLRETVIPIVSKVEG